jgi:hypothetical protein
MRALELPPSSHATFSSVHRRSASLRVDDAMVIFTLARRWQLSTFCTFAQVSDFEPTKTPGLYLLPSINPARSTIPVSNTAWRANARLPSLAELEEFINAPPGVIVTMDTYPTSSQIHGFLGSDGFRPGDTIRLTGNPAIEGGGRIKGAIFAPEQGPIPSPRFLCEVMGWSRPRGGTTSETNLLLLCTNTHSPGSTSPDRAPRQWIIVLS